MESATHSKQPPLSTSSSLAWQYGNLQISTTRLSTALQAYKLDFVSKTFNITKLLRTNIAVLSHSERTAHDILLLLHITYSALDAIETQLARMKVLAEKAISQNVNHAELQTMNLEYQTLTSEVICIAQTTHCNSVFSLTPSLQPLYNNKKNTTSTEHTSDRSLQTALSLSTPAGARQALLAVNEAITSQELIRAHLDAIQNRLKNTVKNLASPTKEDIKIYEGRHKDSGITEMTAFVRNQILTKSTVDIIDQSKAMPRMALHLLGNRH